MTTALRKLADSKPLAFGHASSKEPIDRADRLIPFELNTFDLDRAFAAGHDNPGFVGQNDVAGRRRTFDAPSESAVPARVKFAVGRLCRRRPLHAACSPFRSTMSCSLSTAKAEERA